MARSMSLRSGTGQDDHRLGGRTTYRTDFTANQLVGLLGTHSCSAFTSPPTSWLDCSSYALHRQLRWGLASYVGDSSVFGFFVQASPTKLGTPLVVESCYVSSVCYQAAPCCSDQGADLGQHVWGLDTRMSDDVSKLLDFFSLTLHKIHSLSSSRFGD